jgi:hypothetical protein
LVPKGFYFLCWVQGRNKDEKVCGRINKWKKYGERERNGEEEM